MSDELGRRTALTTGVAIPLIAIERDEWVRGAKLEHARKYGNNN